MTMTTAAANYHSGARRIARRCAATLRRDDRRIDATVFGGIHGVETFGDLRGAMFRDELTEGRGDQPAA